ncbi:MULTISPECIES: hypothetical protein [Pseudomonas]|jgi:hypothetical protein|uniref:Prophage PssSM-01 n=1 Tax=Pseudomonas lundensis TaxID=86185 RepID=A0ABX4GQW9_9PSED|nr:MULTISPECIES: hypothetical protein [Pseudomonas]AOZ13986.1 hypothetical protein AA042_16020 [Pseudomonas lundensis]MBS5838967.1 hypothetical protein [Pseudomonas sp.]NLU01029.1 hypothetical protein [Pseudomonas lundensis]NMZ54696.1 hypothetical protein [Pseudomonas lundensis]NMZ97115.1 hypothetical protein [Pseudomonas lundensis]
MTSAHLVEDDEQQIQASALTFLRKFQPQHPESDQILFCKTVNYLVSIYALSVPAAQKLVSRAYGELKIIDERCRLDLDASTEHLAVITDPESGMTWAVPIKAIVERVIEAPDNCRMRLV